MGKDELKNKFPHLYEKKRRSIAIEFAQGLMRNMFFWQEADIWDAIDTQVAGWWKRMSPRSFWEGIHSVSMGFRATSVVPYITSMNFRWKRKSIEVDKLWFGGEVGPIDSLGADTSVTDVREKMHDPANQEILEATRRSLQEHRTDAATKDLPILILEKDQQRLRTIDGNHRLLQAVVDGKDAIEANIGRATDTPKLFGHWVSTSVMLEMIFWCKHGQETDSDRITSTAKQIAYLIEDSAVGKWYFFNRVGRGDDIRDSVREIVRKELR